MDPAVGLLRSLPIIQPGKAPGMLQGVLIVEDFTAPHKHLAPVPDPLGSIPHNHYHGVSLVQPAQLAQLRIQAREDGVGIPGNSPESDAPPYGVRARFPPVRWATAAPRF